MRRLFTHGIAAAALLVTSGACSDRLTIPNFNNPTPEGIASDPIGGLQLGATGILRQTRTGFEQYVSDVGIFGRESYDYFPTDGRSHTHYVQQNPIDFSGFATGGWTARYQNLRNIFNLLRAVDAVGGISAAQKDAARGFAKTLEALELSYVVASRHNYGAVVQVNENPRDLAPFVARDSAYNFIVARLNEAFTNLQAAGAATFPFALHGGYAGFNTPATFARFNRALVARVQVWRASLGNPACGAGGSTCYQAALAALQASFLDPAGPLGLGVYHVYTIESGDIRNGLSPIVDPDLLAHPSIDADAPLQPGGAKDLRFQTKIRTLAQSRGPVGGAANGITTTLGFRHYPADNSPSPIIRNEELILLRAEARHFTGDAVNALADINVVRTRSGGLAPRGPFLSADDFITELLLQRRYSLLWEGHRWIDVRRFNRISTLPLDRNPGHFRQVQMPIPRAECDFREGSAFPCPAVVPVATP